MFVPWVNYGANGHRTKTEGLVRERFTAVSPADLTKGVGKVFVQPGFICDMMTHNCAPKPGFLVVDEQMRPLSDAVYSVDDPSVGLICVDHYITKSYEEWMTKMRRGSVTPSYFRRYNEFFIYNPDLSDCRTDETVRQQYAEAEEA